MHIFQTPHKKKNKKKKKIKQTMHIIQNWLKLFPPFHLNLKFEVDKGDGQWNFEKYLLAGNAWFWETFSWTNEIQGKKEKKIIKATIQQL